MQLIIFLVMRRMRSPLIVLICAYAFAVLGFVLIPGQDDQGMPWRMSFFHAFYFVSFMGSTIGFGEIPYPFTDAQRLWAAITIYTTVISWLYAIGTLITLIQTPMFRAAVTRNTFIRRVQKIREPFYIVCGYGDTGKQLVEALTRNENQCVVVDTNANRINELQLEELPRDVPGLHADASDSEILLNAGLGSAFCIGVIAITRDDQVNLKIAIACKLLNRDVKVYCWAESRDTGANMASFDTEHIIYPYDTFADYLAIALSQPSTYLLQQWLSSPNGTMLTEPVFPPKGKWVLCGFGRFGKAVYQKLVTLGMPVTVIEEHPELTSPPDGSITGRGTEANTLEQARIHEAVGIIAGTNHDVNNLSIILTAKALCPNLFTIARQEFAINNSIFGAANIDLVTNHSKLISNELLALITTPLTADFLAMSKQQSTLILPVGLSL
ncbi:MAG: NAD-binding protein [Gammaproteobacteria bacterium]